MKCLLVCTATLWFACFGVAPALAGGDSWIFEKSYFSHEPVRDVSIGRQRVSGGPLYTRPQGEYVNSGFRIMRSRVSLKGQMIDHMNVFESWIQTGSQR